MMLWKTSLALVWLAGVLASAQSSNAANSATGAQKSNPSPAAAKADSSPQDFSKQAYVIDQLYTHINEESDGTGTRELTAQVHVLAEAGVKAFAVLSFTYSSANEVVEIDYVRVRKPDGTVIKTPDYNIQDLPAEVSRVAPLYSDIHEKHVAVKGLDVGDVLEYLARFRVVKPEVPGQFWYEDSFATKAIVRDERLEISVPKDKYVKVVSPNFKPEITEEGARRIYRWSHSNLEVKEDDPDLAPRRNLPTLDVQVTSFSSWAEVGSWYAGLQKDPLEVTPAIQAKAAELTKGLKTDDEKIRALYSFVSLKYHYIGLDFGIGRYQPHAADDVLGNGYGDCKDKHTLLASLLKAAGYDAWPALIHVSRNLDPDVPSPAQFNHVITVVPRNGSYVWLDTTPEVSPYGLLLLGLRDKQALVVPTSGPARLMTTPENPPQPQRQEFSMTGKLDAQGTFTGHAEQIYEGDVEVALRAAFRQVPEAQWKDVVQRISHALNFAGEVSEVKVTPPDDLNTPFMISYDYLRKDYSDWDNRRITPPLPPIGMEVVKGSRDVKPEEPVLLGSIGKVSYRARVELPEGFKAVAPESCHLVESYAEYEDSTRIDRGVMTTVRELKIKKPEVPLSDWEGYRKFGMAMSDDEFSFVTLSGGSSAVASSNKDSGIENTGKATGTAGNAGAGAGSANSADLDEEFRQGVTALQERDYERAVELYQKVVAGNPNYRGAHFNLGIALASQNRVSDSMDQFRKEEEVSPDDPRSYQVVASYLTRTGRRDDAIQEWRKLLKADPQNRSAAVTLGDLLYQAGKYPDAAEVLEAAVKIAPDSASLLMQLGNTYMKTGQKDKAVADLQKAADQKNDDPEVLNNVAWALVDNNTNLDLAQKYGEKAVAELEKQGQEAKSPTEGMHVTYDYTLVWDTLGWVYFAQGDVKRAETLVRSAWLLGEDSQVGEHLGEIYEKENKRQEAARAYEYALSVSAVPFSSIQSAPDMQKAYNQRTDEIKARYKKLTGKEVGLAEIHRLPNGEWTQTPAEQLRHTREVKLSNESKLSGTAVFAVSFQPGKTESADYVSGDDELKPLSRELAAAHYPLEFPPDSAAILVVTVAVNCRAGATCTGTLVNPSPGPAHSPGAVY